MNNTFTISKSQTFTVTQAKYLASKVATDLKRIQRFYGQPNDERIAAYEAELVQLLKYGYLKEITYGFQKSGKWIEPTLRYTAQDLDGNSSNDDPGRIRAGANIADSSFCSYLNYNRSWEQTSISEQNEYKKILPFQRGDGSDPGINGYLENDKTYSSGGKALNRSSVKSY